MLCTRTRVSRPTSARPFSTFDTVATETPADAATSASVGDPCLDDTAPPSRSAGSARDDLPLCSGISVAHDPHTHLGKEPLHALLDGPLVVIPGQRGLVLSGR